MWYVQAALCVSPLLFNITVGLVLTYLELQLELARRNNALRAARTIFEHTKFSTYASASKIKMTFLSVI